MFVFQSTEPQMKHAHTNRYRIKSTKCCCNLSKRLPNACYYWEANKQTHVCTQTTIKTYTQLQTYNTTIKHWGKTTTAVNIQEKWNQLWAVGLARTKHIIWMIWKLLIMLENTYKVQLELKTRTKCCAVYRSTTPNTSALKRTVHTKYKL